LGLAPPICAKGVGVVRGGSFGWGLGGRCEEVAGIVSRFRKLKSAVHWAQVGEPTVLKQPHLPQTMPIWCFSLLNKVPSPA
jgi:hypothetical protein